MDNVKLWESLRAKVVHEDTWIQHRVNWLLATNTILLGGYASILTTGSEPVSSQARLLLTDTILAAIPLAGIGLNLFGFASLFAAWRAIVAAEKEWVTLSVGEPPSTSLPHLHSRGTARNLAEWLSYFLAIAVLTFWGFLAYQTLYLIPFQRP